MKVPRDGLLIFDGDCGFCTWAAAWVSAGWSGDSRAVPWQSVGSEGLAALGLSVEDVSDAAWWVDGVGGSFRGHRAMSKSLQACRGWRSYLGSLLDVPPFAWVAAASYPVIVRYRHRLPGATEACRIDYRDR